MAYRTAFKIARSVWGKWYEQERKQAEVQTSRLSSVGEARRRGFVRVTCETDAGGSSEGESERD